MSDRAIFSDTMVLSIVGNFSRYYRDFDSKKILEIFNKIAHAKVPQDIKHCNFEHNGLEPPFAVQYSFLVCVS